jgi:hypothetical protein
MVFSTENRLELKRKCQHLRDLFRERNAVQKVYVLRFVSFFFLSLAALREHICPKKRKGLHWNATF